MTRGPEDVYDDVAVDAWIQDDPDPVTRAELTELLSAARSHGEQAQAARRALSPSAAPSPSARPAYEVVWAGAPTG